MNDKDVDGRDISIGDTIIAVSPWLSAGVHKLQIVGQTRTMWKVRFTESNEEYRGYKIPKSRKVYII